MARSRLSAGDAVGILEATPLRLTQITSGVAASQLSTAPEPGEWSAVEVLAHLRACADVWGGCMSRLMTEDVPTIKAVNPRTWIEQTDYRQQGFAASLEAFRHQRTTLLTTVLPTSADGWARAAIITGGGAPQRRTVLDFGTRMALHERTHVRQMERLAAES